MFIFKKFKNQGRCEDCLPKKMAANFIEKWDFWWILNSKEEWKVKLNYLKTEFSKINYEDKEEKHMGFENGPRKVAMHGLVGVGPGCH